MAERYTPRGFAVYAEFTDAYGASVRVQQSSSAERARVWIFCDDEGGRASPHLDVEQAKRVRDALDEFIGSATEAAP